MRVWGILALAMAVAGPAAALDAKSETMVTTAVAKLRAQLDRELFDYPSARFQSVRASITPSGDAVLFCGEMNSKNRMGGYVGWQAFSAIVDEDVSLTAGEERKFLVGVVCDSQPEVPRTGDISTRLSAR